MSGADNCDVWRFAECVNIHKVCKP